MGQEVSSGSTSACSHGGIYSVDHRLVRVDCSSSVNPLGTPQSAIRAIREGARVLSPIYPDPQCAELKKSLSRYLHADPEWITVGNGAMEIIYWFARAFAGKRVVVPAPTFCEYELASRKVGAAVTLGPLRDFELDADSIIKDARGADAIFLCNPNNPTGMLATREIERIVQNVDRRTAIMLDECFVELVDNPGKNSLMNRIREFENLVILRSLTKSFGLAGLRLGYGVSRPELARRLSDNRIPWNVNGLAQAAGVAVLADTKHLPRVRALIRKERRFLFSRISRMKKFSPHKSDANYFMVRVKGRNSTELRDMLLKKSGLLVRDCSTFTGMNSEYVRVAVKNHRENLMLVRALEDLDRG